MILDAGADYRMVDVEIGKTNVDPSRARLEVTASDEVSLQALLEALQVHGAAREPAARLRQIHELLATASKLEMLR